MSTAIFVMPVLTNIKKKLFIAKQNDSFSPGRHKPIFLDDGHTKKNDILFFKKNDPK